MLEVYNITTLQEYELVKERNIEPLIDNRFFIIDIVLRVQLQNELFGLATLGKRNIPKANDKFYHWVWDNKLNVCEECLRPLENYSSVYISHILTKGARPEIAHDPRNCNILCYKHHEQWEDSIRRKKMNIYPRNLKKIETLKSEYSLL